ncbi:MAG: hypothetical protein R3293_20795 [Candidatus Promineifilaceae bacterium]|nr:hypothetical protein [Candidatus Promineifilaceae bacterium]
MAEKILTRHPENKQGVNIDKNKYDAIRKAILDALNVHQEIRFKDLADAVDQELEGNFVGSIPWYVTTVKLDLEARGIIERVPKSSPQRLRRAP